MYYTIYVTKKIFPKTILPGHWDQKIIGKATGQEGKGSIDKCSFFYKYETSAQHSAWFFFFLIFFWTRNECHHTSLCTFPDFWSACFTSGQGALYHGIFHLFSFLSYVFQSSLKRCLTVFCYKKYIFSP